MAVICPIRSKRDRPRCLPDIVQGIVDDYDSDYKPLHAVDLATFLSIHSTILIYFYVFLFKDWPCVFSRYDLQRRKPPLRCACLPLPLRLLLPHLSRTS
jgi:hypothetical protein